MAKTIKVIDLLNKMANNEELPKEIRFKGYKYKWNGIAYVSEKAFVQTTYCLGYMVNEGNLLTALNDTVEILEEQQDIDIQEIKEMPNGLINTEDPIEHIIEQHKKINELVQAVKQLDNNIKDKE